MPARHIWADGDALTTTRLNAWPGGVVDYKNGSTSDQGSIGSSATDVTGLSIVWTAESSRLYESVAVLVVQQNTSAGIVTISITDAAGTARRAGSFTLAASDLATVVVRDIEGGISGSVTRKVRASTSAGTVTVIGTFSRHATFTVQDIGLA